MGDWEERCHKNIIGRENSKIKDEKKEHKRWHIIVEYVRHTWQSR